MHHNGSQMAEKSAQDRHTWVLAVVALALSIPTIVAIIIHSAWKHTAEPRMLAAAVVGVGMLGYALMFLAFFYALPWLLRRRFGDHVARRWKYAALRASTYITMITILNTANLCQI